MKKLLLLIALLQSTYFTQAMNESAADLQRANTIKKLRAFNDENNWPNRKNLITQLIENDPRNVNICGHLYNTPLIEAALLNDVPFANYLLQHNADVNKKNQEGRTALDETVNLLNLGIEVNNADVNCATPLYWNISYLNGTISSPSGNNMNCQQLLDMLILYGANPDQEISFAGTNNTPRKRASPQTYILIEQAERKKRIREHLISTLINTLIPTDLSLIIANYVNQDVRITEEEIALAIERKSVLGAFVPEEETSLTKPEMKTEKIRKKRKVYTSLTKTFRALFSRSSNS